MESTTTSTTYQKASPLHTFKFIRRKALNRAFAFLYALAILALFYHHIMNNILFKSNSFFISISILFSDIILAFMWLTTQSFRMSPAIRQVFPENLEKVLKNKEDFPGLDIFICTADPFKEPPLDVVNTALSVMGYDYPTDKISVYVSDDGGSQLTLFAFMEAAKFARYWLPFCRENNIIDRCPEVYFTSSSYSSSSQTENIKIMYESMKIKIENVIEKGKISEEYITSDQEHQAFSKWTQQFIRQEHPSVIQVLLETGNDKDIEGNSMPNLIYVSRGKSKTSPHHFKAGALNALLRVSATMTNAPIILTLDCDMFSNDPLTPHRVLCFLTEHSGRPRLGYIQFPQRYHGLNKADTYASEIKRLFILNPLGMDGLEGPSYVGTGCFFRRRVFFGCPSAQLQPQIPELSPDYVVNNKVMKSDEILKLAHHVAACNYEHQTNWGSQIGFRYGSLVEDYYTGYRLQCEGWQSVFCNLKRPAFLGDIPISLNDVLSQNKRWSVGLLEVGFSSKYSPITFGVKAMRPLMALAYAHYAYWPIWSFPITIYSCLPQLTLLNKMAIFPKAADPWFFLYVFLFVGAYGQDCIDFVLEKGTFERWWSEQRMWLMRGLSSYMFGAIEYLTKHLGISTQGFNVTSKLVDDEQSKRYDQGKFEFGVHSPMFVPLSVAAMINLIAFLVGVLQVVKGGYWDEFLLQILMAGFGVLNSLPIYEAIVLRTDKGRMPAKTTIISIALAWGLYVASSFILKICHLSQRRAEQLVQHL